MVENPQIDDEKLALYFRIAKVVLDEALSIGYPLGEAKAKAIEFVEHGVTKSSSQEPPKKPT